VALRGDARYAARLEHAVTPGAPHGPALVAQASYAADWFRLRPGRPGDLASLELAVVPRRPPGPGEVTVRVQAAGLAQRDLRAVAARPGAAPPAGPPLGTACAGVVTAVGTGVTHVAPGDHVLGIDLRDGSDTDPDSAPVPEVAAGPVAGTAGSVATLPAAAVVPRPATLSAAAAAGQPAANLAPWQALRNVARVLAGERVLIHPADSCQGHAAIAVARALGARVLATARTPAGHRALAGLGAGQVLDALDPDLGDQVRAVTGGAGADVVLAFGGQAASDGTAAGGLSRFGRYVEIRENGHPGGTWPAGTALPGNATLAAVDLAGLQAARPAGFAALLGEVAAALDSGHLAPLPVREFGLDAAAEAFGLLAAGYPGPVVLTVPDAGKATVTCAGPARPDGAYIVTGGLTGVGLETARWLAEGGAGHVVVSGRRAPSPAAEAVLAGLDRAGCRVSVALGDIAEPGTADRLVAEATSGGLPLRGIVHSAMVLADAAVIDISAGQLDQAWRPKVTGAWRLHEAAAGHDLDWLVLHSSMAALAGSPGQAAYAAASTWLDSFAAWRTARGQPTVAVAWGAWGETGAAARLSAGRGRELISTGDGLAALGAILAARPVLAGYISGDPAAWVPAAARSVPLLAGLATGHRRAVLRGDSDHRDGPAGT
jgi:polyketide synthase 2/polyketide synthase 5